MVVLVLATEPVVVVDVRSVSVIEAGEDRELVEELVDV